MTKENRRSHTIKPFVRFSAGNNEKHNSVAQIIKETIVCDYLALYADDVNHILARAGEPFNVGLQFEEAKNDETVNLNKLDPIAADFIKSLKDKIAFANRKMLKSFRLKLSIEELTT
jgi:hypothetical protein